MHARPSVLYPWDWTGEKRRVNANQRLLGSYYFKLVLYSCALIMNAKLRAPQTQTKDVKNELNEMQSLIYFFLFNYLLSRYSFVSESVLNLQEVTTIGQQ